MGSLFYINVPTRENEVILRQKELSITVNKQADSATRDVFRSRRRGSTSSSSAADGKAAEIEGQDVRNTASVDSVDVYDAMVDGKRANVVVSQDSMAVYTADNHKPVGVGVGRRGSDETRDTAMANAISNTFLEKHLEESLKKFGIYDATWGTSIDGGFSQVSFTVNVNRAERIITFLVNLGIGTKFESTLSVCAAIIYYNQHSEELGQNKSDDHGDGKDSFKSKFIASIKSRLTVAQVVQTVQSNAILSFDYIVLIFIAGCIAALGLLENSSVNLVASMLISPLMGPIMAGCFGTVIRDTKLLKTGLFSELVGLSICLCVGFLFGTSVAWAPFKGPWHDIQMWPTDEMISRGKLRGIVVGAMVAIPSGAGVALSILAGNAGSLVGVAISASLLPPAVNCGMFWGMAFVISITEFAKGHDSTMGCSSHYNGSKKDGPFPFQVQYKHNRNETEYCQDVIREYTYLGLVSFGLTMVNIVLILIVGFGILKLKEVAPHTTRKAMKRFWKEDLKVMREYNRTHGSFNKQALLNEISESDNPADIKARLNQDMVFNQVQRRTFGASMGNILDTSSRDSEDKNDVENGGNEKKKGFFSGWFGGSSGRTSEQDIDASARVSRRPRPAFGSNIHSSHHM